jgi:hypothetical protein
VHRQGAVDAVGLDGGGERFGSNGVVAKRQRPLTPVEPVQHGIRGTPTAAFPAADGGPIVLAVCQTVYPGDKSYYNCRSNSGAAGNRTRVLRHSLKASPCAVRYASTRISRSRKPAEMTIPVAVSVPMRPATERIG